MTLNGKLPLLLLSLGVPAAFALPVTVDPADTLASSWAVEWNTAGNAEGWTGSGATVSVADGIFSGSATTTDSRVQLSNFAGGPNMDLGYNDFMELRVQVPASYTGAIQIYYGTTSYTIATASGGTTTASTTGFNITTRVITIPADLVPDDGAFHTYRIDLGLEPMWRATLRDLRVDAVDGAGTSGMAFALDYLRIGDEPSAKVYQPRYTTECPAAGGTFTVGGVTHTVLSMESKHFRFLWSTTVDDSSFWTTSMPQGTLRNLEEAWQVYVKKLGYREPSRSIGTTTGTEYKLNVTTWHSGYWAGPDDFSGTSLARLNITPDGLRVDAPTWVIPHELMHCFQFHNTTGNVPGEWFEFHANYGRERWLQHYQAFYPNTSGIDPTHMRSAHLNIGEGREYYLCWPFFQYIDENPDGLPDIGEGTTVKLWQQTNSGEYPFMALERLTPTTSLKDIAGYFGRRGATYNYQTKTAANASLALFGQPLDNAATARWQFTDLVQRIDDPTWWRVPYEMAPAQGSYTIHELVPAGSGAGRVVSVNLRGLADGARGADWRASLIVVPDTGAERYSSLWSSGSNSVTLAANENKVYLSVAGAPDTFYYGGADEVGYPYRSHPAKARFPYEVQVTGANPRQRDNGAATGLVQHSNGGGYKASSATVAATAYLGPNARVIGTANVGGTARIEDYALVSGNAVVSGSAVISGHAWVRSGTVTGNAKVRDWALVEGGTVSGSARILEHGNFKGGSVTDLSTVKGCAASLLGNLTGNAIIDGDYGDFFSGRDIASSIAFGHLPYAGAPDSYLKALPSGLYASYDFAAAHDSRIRDQYGVTDGFTVGSPVWTAQDAKRKGFLMFNGSTQSVMLDRSVADLRDFSFSAWVKPVGGAANQTVLWLGASATRRLSFTPDDGAGHAKFSIVNGGAEQNLVGTAALVPGVWSHVAVALDSATSTGTLYVNGTASASGVITLRSDQLLAANTATGLQYNYLGRSQGTLMPMYAGALDNVQFYGKALSAAEVTALQPPTAVATSGTLYVDLRASDATAGAATWLNNGTLGSFARTNSPAKVANVLSTGIPGVQFNGTNQAYTGPNTPTDLDGSSDRSIEVWVYNPSLSDEESMVSWAYRGTVRSDMSFNYGSASNYNAVTHWGEDMAWGSIPTIGAWHHLVYTYDGNLTPRAYVDGVLTATGSLTGVLSTFANQSINLACQRNTAGGTRSKYFSGYLNTVRIHGGALTAAQVAGNFEMGPSGGTGNVAPVATPQSKSVSENGSVAITLAATDGNGDGLTYHVWASPANGTISGIAPNLVYTPAVNFSGQDSFNFVASDGAVNSATVTVTITVNPVNGPPVANAQSVQTDEDTALPVTLTGADPDEDSLTYSLTILPANGTLSGTPPNLIYTPFSNFSGTDAFGFEVSDGAATSGTAVVTIVILPVNDPPVASLQNVAVNEGGSVPIILTGSDVEGASLTFAISTPPAHGSLEGTFPNLSYVPAPGYSGPDSFSFVANDGAADSAPAVVAIVVRAAPLISAIPDQTADFSVPVLVPIALADADSPLESLTLSAIAAETVLVPTGNLVFAGAAGERSLTITPGTGLAGTTVITVTVGDGSATSERSFTVRFRTREESWRTQYFATDENTGNAADSADPDADGQTNLHEYMAGTNPTNFSDVIHLTPVSGSHSSFTVNGIVGRVYVLQRSLDLSSQWEDLQQAGPLAGPQVISLTDLLPPQDKSFYRLMVNWPEMNP